MRPIPCDSPLAVGDVLHQAAFGFAVVTEVDAEGASLRWESLGNLHPGWVSRESLRDAYHLTTAAGLLSLTVRDIEHARRVTAADASCAVGRLLIDIGPATADEIQDWLAARRIVPRPEFAEWWKTMIPTLTTDSRFRQEAAGWTVTKGAHFADPTIKVPNVLPAPGSWPAAEGLARASDMARAVAALHAVGQTIDGGRDAFRVDGDAVTVRGRPGGQPEDDVLLVGRTVLEQLLGSLPDVTILPVEDVLQSIGGRLPDAPFELFGVLEQAVTPDPSLRFSDGFGLLYALEMAGATAALRARFPHNPAALVAAGFDSHIGMSRAVNGQVNQDALVLAGDPNCALLCVADGISVSTAGSGDRASRLLAETLKTWWRDRAESLRGASPARIHTALSDVLLRANRAIITEASRLVGGKLSEHIPMGTTFVLAVTTGNRVHLVSLGDSRAWLVSAHGTALLTADHNLQAELLHEHVQGRETQWTDERFALTGYCGHLDEEGRAALPKLHVRTFTLLPGEWVVMATDGFSDFAHDEDAGLSGILRSAVAQGAGPTPSRRAMHVARQVVQAANDGGGGDNVTVLAFTLYADDHTPDNDDRTDPR